MNRSVQKIVDQVYVSGCLGKSKRQRDLLTYLLKENRAGRLEKIKEYNIAVDVLGRAANFNSVTDSIVRAEMRRLRNNLSLFNGGSQDMQLEIPRAHYEVIITNRVRAQPYSLIKSYIQPIVMASSAMALIASLALVNNPQQQSLAVASDCSSTVPNVDVVNSGSLSDLQLYVDKIIQSSLSQYSNIQFVNNIQACTESGTPSFTLDYMVFEKNDMYSVALTAYYERPSQVVGFANMNGIITEPNNKDDLYYSIVKAVGDFAKPYGEIPQYAVTKNWAVEEIASNYKCIIAMYDSYVSDSSEDYSRALSCLTRSSQSKFATLDNKGGLALSYIVQHRKTRNSSTEDPMLEAQKLIDSSGDEWIQSAEMTMAKILYEVDRPDYNAERLKAVMNIAEKNYSENPHILIIVAGYAGFKLGDWERAIHLSTQILLIHSETDDSVFSVRAAFELVKSQSDVDLSVCLLAYSENSLFSNLLVNSCARRVQNVEWIKRTDDNLIRLGYSNTDKRVNYIQSRQYAQKFSDAFVSSVQLSVN
ncbi:MAG: hypothetical protein COA91_01580 [Robiginitomaculum sp.]|nr:MAG: hypothetical protein COA91_01580 [Robiginitomaculum sp.]